MPEMPQPVSASEAPIEEAVDLPDPMAALDLLSSSPEQEQPAETPTAASNADLLTALDSPVDTESEVQEISVADYKWKDSVLDSIIDKFEINDRDAFLVHATAFDANKNLYLTKKELTEAAKEWVEMKTPIADLEPVEESLEPVLSAADELPAPAEPEEDVEVVVAEVPVPEPVPEPAPQPVLEAPPLPAPPVLELPPLPAPAPEATVEVQPAGPPEPAASIEESSDPTEDYRELWKRRSDKSLPQMYGAIDRIGSGEIGSLLDRYSDRFGHELDREIIVMRRAEQDARREAVPVVELISSPEEDEEHELQSQLTEVEDILRPLQQAYKAAENNAEKKRLAPALKALIAERKILLSVISGEEDEDALDEIPERPDIPDYDSEDEEDDDVIESADDFSEFFNVINQLLGEMPEDWVNNFLESKGFALFQKVGADPAGANEKDRKKFFNMINNELGSMPEDMLDAFVTSPEFELYKSIGEKYGE